LPLVREVDQAFHELRPRTGDFRAVVQIDQQPVHVGIGGLPLAPPPVQTVGHEVAGVTRGAENQVELMAVDLQNAGRRQHGVGMHVVVGGSHALPPPGHAAT
jgi:hypothetical protein